VVLLVILARPPYIIDTLPQHRDANEDEQGNQRRIASSCADTRQQLYDRHAQEVKVRKLAELDINLPRQKVPNREAVRMYGVVAVWCLGSWGDERAFVSEVDPDVSFAIGSDSLL
jgi:hypothetical protein